LQYKYFDNYVKIFIVTFDQMNASLLNKSIYYHYLLINCQLRVALKWPNISHLIGWLIYWFTTRFNQLLCQTLADLTEV